MIRFCAGFLVIQCFESVSYLVKLSVIINLLVFPAHLVAPRRFDPTRYQYPSN